MQTKLYAKLASLLVANHNCLSSGNIEWAERHACEIDRIVKKHFPSGSGFDSGTSFDFSASRADKLVFNTSFHHMNDAGYYDGWTEHSVTVRPSLAFGCTLKISGRDRNQIKDYIADCFSAALNEEI